MHKPLKLLMKTKMWNFHAKSYLHCCYGGKGTFAWGSLRGKTPRGNNVFLYQKDPVAKQDSQQLSSISDIEACVSMCINLSIHPTIHLSFCPCMCAKGNIGHLHLHLPLIISNIQLFHQKQQSLLISLHFSARFYQSSKLRWKGNQRKVTHLAHKLCDSPYWMKWLYHISIFFLNFSLNNEGKVNLDLKQLNRSLHHCYTAVLW